MSYRIITVCTGNICRSPMAEIMIAQAADECDLDVSVDSAGTTGWEAGKSMDPRALASLREHGFDVGTEHVARKFIDADFDDHDLVLALDVDHYNHLRSVAPSTAAKDKVHMLRSFDPAVSDLDVQEQGIDDPWYGDASDFESTWQHINAAVPGILEHFQVHSRN